MFLRRSNWVSQWLSSKESACNAGNLGSIPGEGNGFPLHFLPGTFHGQSNVTGYNPRGYKESDMIEQHTHTYIQGLHFHGFH